MANSNSSSPNSGKHPSGEAIPSFLMRIHMLGHFDIFNTGKKPGLDQVVQRRIKVSRALLTDRAETVFDDTLNCLAELALFEAELPGTFPGIEAVRPFLRPHRVGKLPGLTPWPAIRHLYVAEDFEDVREIMANRPIQVTDANNPQFLDYLRLGESDGDVSENFDLKTLRERFHGIDEEGHEGDFINLRLSDLGTRLVTSKSGIHLLQILTPADETADTLIARLARLMGVPGNGSPYKIAYFTTLSKDDRGDDQVKTSFMLIDSYDLIDASIGWSPKPGGHPLLTEEQASSGAWANAELFKPLGMRALLQMGLPAYFEFQLDAVEDNVFDGAGRRLIEETQDTESSKRRKSPRPYKPKMFKVVRALRYPSRDFTTAKNELDAEASSDAPRKEPEAQVSVKGFWRRIGEGSFGKGPDGQPEVGRTWVTHHVRWKDKPPSQQLPFAKEPIMPHLTDPRRKDVGD